MSDDDGPLPYRGMVFYERAAIERALRETREEWLPLLEGWLAKTVDPYEQGMLIAEVRRLRRLLGTAPSADDRRAATRERVRPHRERKRQGVVLRPGKEPPSVTAEQILDDLKQQLAARRRTERVKRQAKG